MAVLAGCSLWAMGFTAALQGCVARETSARSTRWNCVNQVARWLVMYLKRPSMQPQHSLRLDEQGAETHGLGELRAWIVEHLASDLDVDRLACQVGVSGRNFCSAFQAGMAPSKFVEAVRVEAAQRWLAQADHALDEVARRSGFGSADALRRTFRRHRGLTPRDYRDSMRA